MHRIVIIIIIMVLMNQCQRDLQPSSQRSPSNTVSIDCHRIPAPCFILWFLHILFWNWSGRTSYIVHELVCSIHLYKVTLDLIHSGHCFFVVVFFSFVLFSLFFFVCVQIDNSCLRTHSNNMDAIVSVVARSLSSLWSNVCTQINIVVFKRGKITIKCGQKLLLHFHFECLQL